ncbi:MAG TPA: GTPase ObgE [Candidatus Hydrogenedentes bacterium]|nr:GTPase ObgE [Candidatus Hydrogenedentota bacterium]HOL76404.1 GTPase ObgE [Candidatus Hydrogenedentota bacterium]HPO85442.1 GTPase ObgE [Candidatus Hydrogenedentota bacterium]
MFVDRARIRVTGGAGGNGCCSFRREKYVPRGGPDGGDGGKGGDILFVADKELTSLLDVHYHYHWKGKPGGHGSGNNRHGRNGEDVIVRVPCGTVVRKAETGEIVADLVQDGQQFLAARGGKGGMGNTHFATSTNRVPRFAEKGEPGEDVEYLLELKLIADVGLVGLPNAGKSTFLASATAARPKIAPYPFTTLSPNLGVALLSDHRTLTLADIPGIIEGASEGKGLGHEFLRHIERTRLLLFLIDLGDPDPLTTRRILEAELAKHSPIFQTRPRVFALNKADVPENRLRFDAIRPFFEEPFLISGLTGEGLPELLEHLWQRVDVIRKTPEKESVPEKEYVYEPPFTLERCAGGFRIRGETIVRAARMTDFNNEEAAAHFQMRLRKMGILKALKRMGAQEGDSVFIDTIELEYDPD